MIPGVASGTVTLQVELSPSGSTGRYPDLGFCRSNLVLLAEIYFSYVPLAPNSDLRCLAH